MYKETACSLKVPYNTSRGAVAQSEERPLKVLVWCNSTNVGSKGGRKILASPSVAEIRLLFENK